MDFHTRRVTVALRGKLRHSGRVFEWYISHVNRHKKIRHDDRIFCLAFVVYSWDLALDDGEGLDDITLFDHIHHFLTITHDCAEDRVLTIQPVCFDVGDEKL